MGARAQFAELEEQSALSFGIDGDRTHRNSRQAELRDRSLLFLRGRRHVIRSGAEDHHECHELPARSAPALYSRTHQSAPRVDAEKMRECRWLTPELVLAHEDSHGC